MTGQEQLAHDEILAWCRSDASTKYGHMVMRDRTLIQVDLWGLARCVVLNVMYTDGARFEGETWVQVQDVLVDAKMMSSKEGA